MPLTDGSSLACREPFDVVASQFFDSLGDRARSLFDVVPLLLFGSHDCGGVAKGCRFMRASREKASGRSD